MAYPAYIRDKARELRVKKKLTIDEIAERLAISRTTIYSWVGDLPVPRDPTRMRAAAFAAGQATRRKHERIRAAAYEDGRRQYVELAMSPTFRDFICMYIGEGYKRNRNKVALANSDPAVIRLATYWMRRLATNPVSFSFQYHQDQNPEQLVKFWCAELDAQPEQFSYQRKSNSGSLNGRVWRSKYGVLTVFANDTNLRAKLQAWIDCLTEEWLESTGHGA